MERVFKRDGLLFKLLPCLLITMYAVMCLYGSSVYATDSDIYELSFNGDTYTFTEPQNKPDSCQNLYIGISGAYARAVFFDTMVSNTVNPSVPFYYEYVLNFRTSEPSYEQIQSFLDTISALNVSSYTYHNEAFSLWDYNQLPNKLLFCSIDIVDTNQTLWFPKSVFQAPPQQVEVQGIIAEKTQGTEMNKTLQEITGILPVILLVIVGAIAIRKGIQFLIQLLKRQ